MLKKFSLIAALLIMSLALVFIGCGEGLPWPETDESAGGSVNPIVDDANFFRITGRSVDYDTIDIRVGNMIAEFTSGKDHTFTVWGKANPNTDGIRFAQGGSPWARYSGDVEAGADGMFILKRDFTWAEISSAPEGKIRIQLPASLFTFFVYEIAIEDADKKSIYKMSTDAEVQGAANGVNPFEGNNAFDWLMNSGGSPKVIIVPGEEIEDVIPPDVTYDGGTVTYTASLITHNDPGFEVTAVTAFNKETGVVTMATGASLMYAFPADSGDIKLADFDNIKITYTISNIDVTSGGAGNAKARIVTLKSDWDEPYLETGGNWANLGQAAANVEHNLLTWGDLGTGGFAIMFNRFDIENTDPAQGGCDSFDLKITKIEFTKGTRYTINFVTPQVPHLNDIKPVTILQGLPLRTRMQTLANPGWTFLGWFDGWTSGNGSGNLIASTTNINSNMTLYAGWANEILQPITVNATANGTLFNAVGGWVGPATQTPIDVDSKSYWVVGDTRTTGWDPQDTEDNALFAAV